MRKTRGERDGHARLQRLDATLVFELGTGARVLQRCVSAFPALTHLRIATQFNALPGDDSSLADYGGATAVVAPA
ncbi:hypothetical protein CLOP_g14977, partial [Closterium sp. NIES-67]